MSLAAFGLISLGASCALPFWSFSADRNEGGATASGTNVASSASTSGSSSTGQGGSPPSCTQPGAPVCGASTQQCTDGNAFELDGCTSACGYEVVQRISSLALATSLGPAFCQNGKNQFGRAIDPTVIGIVNQPLADEINNGSVNVLTKFDCLSDLGGADAVDFTVGVVDGLLDPAKGLWTSGAAPEDWPFLADAQAVSAGVEVFRLSPATITSHTLVAGPSSIMMHLVLEGSPAALTFDNAVIRGKVSTTTSPPGPPPASLAANLVVFDSVTATDTTEGLCGDIRVSSLAAVPVPQQIAVGGTTACLEGFKACGGNVVGPSCNSLLDVLVVGCTIGIAAVKPTQPDVPGSGSQVVALTEGTGHKVTVPPSDNDGYSSYFTFAMTRAHISGQSCQAVGDCQSGQQCVSNVCSPR